jgi:uncharacterized protein YggU (UPF0235/DUF167 family)
MERCEIAVRLTPRARVNEIAGERDGVLLVRVTVPPMDGRANAALYRLIAKRAGVLRADDWLRIIRAGSG